MIKNIIIGTVSIVAAFLIVCGLCFVSNEIYDSMYPDTVDVSYDGQPLAGYTGYYDITKMSESVIKIEFNHNGQNIIWFFCGNINIEEYKNVK